MHTRAVVKAAPKSAKGKLMLNSGLGGSKPVCNGVECMQGNSTVVKEKKKMNEWIRAQAAAKSDTRVFTVNSN